MPSPPTLSHREREERETYFLSSHTEKEEREAYSLSSRRERK